MKNANYAILIAFILFGFGCSNDPNPEEEVQAIESFRNEALVQEGVEAIEETDSPALESEYYELREKSIKSSDSLDYNIEELSRFRQEHDRLEYELIREIRLVEYEIYEIDHSDLDGEELYELIRELRKLHHMIRRMNSRDEFIVAKRRLRYIRAKVNVIRAEIRRENKELEASNEKYNPRAESFEVRDEEPMAMQRKEAIEAKTNLLKGKIAYRIQDSMFVNSISRVAMTISENRILVDSIEKIVQELTVIGDQPISLKEDIKIENIEIGKKMRARLIDPQAPTYPAFNVTNLSSETQLVDLNSENPTSWQWDVFPLKEGDYILNLVVDVIMVAEGEETPVTIPVFDKEITVSTNITDDTNMMYVASSDELKNINSKWGTLELILLSIVALIAIIAIFIYGLLTKNNQVDYGKFDIKELIQKVFPKNVDEEKIKRMIKEDKTEKALDLLEELTNKNKEFQNQIIIHKSRLTNLKRKNEIGTTSDEELNSGRIKINLALLRILDEIKNSD